MQVEVAVWSVGSNVVIKEGGGELGAFMIGKVVKVPYQHKGGPKQCGTFWLNQPAWGVDVELYAKQEDGTYTLAVEQCKTPLYDCEATCRKQHTNTFNLKMLREPVGFKLCTPTRRRNRGNKDPVVYHMDDLTLQKINNSLEAV